MRIMERVMLILLCLGLGLSGAWAQGLSGRYFIGDKQPVEFNNIPSIDSYFGKLRLAEGGDGSISRITNIQIDGGRITNADWLAFRKYLSSRGGQPESGNSFTALSSLELTNSSLVLDDMEDGDGKVVRHQMTYRLKSFLAPKLKRLSCSVFFMTRLDQVNLRGVETVGSGAFHTAVMLEQLDLPSAKTIGERAFMNCQNLRVLKTQSLEKLVGQAGAGETLWGCSRLSEWHLGTSFDPNSVPAGDPAGQFWGLPKNRNIILVDGQGVPLTGSALAMAANRFKTSPGWKDGKWHGWHVGEKLHKITITVVGEKSSMVYTLPNGQAKAGTKVEIFPTTFFNQVNNAGAIINGIKVQRKGGEVLKEIDPKNELDYEFEMPDGEVEILVTTNDGSLTVKYYFKNQQGEEGSDTFEGKTMWSTCDKFQKKYPNMKQDDIWRVELLAGQLSILNWNYLPGYNFMREFEIMNTSAIKFVDQPRERLLHVDHTRYFERHIKSLVLRRVRRVPRYFLRETPSISSIMLPDVEEFADRAFYRIPSKYRDYPLASSIVLGVPGNRLPEASKESFVHVGAGLAQPAELFLTFLNKDGEELTGTAREAAVALYKADERDGNASDNLWFGWQLDHLRVRVDAASQVNGSVDLITPAMGVAWRGAPVQFTVDPNPGYGVEKVEYVVEGETERRELTPDSELRYNLTMPGRSITIYVTYGARRYNVEVEASVPKGSLSAAPNTNVAVGTKVEVECTPDEGYEVDLDELYYQRLEGGLPVEPKVPIVADGDGKYTFEMPDYSVKVFGKFKAKKWSLTHCENIEGGMLTTVPAPGDEVPTDKSVIVIGTPANGYLPGELTWKNLSTGTKQPVVHNQFTMPAANVEVCATFAKIDQGDPNKFVILAEAVPAEGGSVKAEPYHDLVAGARSTITVDAHCGYRYVENTLRYIKLGDDESVADNWLALSPSGSGYELTMPSYSVKLRAEFAPLAQTIKLPFDGTGVHPASGSKVSVKSPASPSEYKTGTEIVLQTEVKIGWKLKTIRWREDDGVSEWKALNPMDPRFVMPCKGVEVDAEWEQIGFTVIEVGGLTGGTVSATPRKDVGVGADVIVDVMLEPEYSLVLDAQDPTKRAVWWSPLDATDSSVRATLEEGKTKFRIPYKHRLYRFEMPDESVVKLGSVWVWADFTNEGNRVGFLPVASHDGKPRGHLTANRYASVPVDYEVRITYVRDADNSAWALNERSVEYIEAELVGGELKAKEGAEWIAANGSFFRMPNSHVLVRAEIYPTGNSVFQFPDVRNGRIVATPWANVDLDALVQLEAIPDEGYELKLDETGAAFDYTQQGQEIWNHIKAGDGGTFRMPNYSVYVRCRFVPKKFTVTAEQSEGGELRPSPVQAEVGSIVFVDYSRSPGWVLVPGSIEWAKEGSDEWVKAEEGRFTMPASNVRVRAQFTRMGSEEFEIELLTEGKGSLNVYDGDFQVSDKMRVAGGTVLRIERLAEDGWQVADLIVNDDTWTDETFTVTANTKIKAIFVESSVTSVSMDRLVHVYPNPFDGELHVDAPGALELSLYTVSGLRVHREGYRAGGMQLRSLPSGVYLLRIRFAEGVEVVRRVVKR